MRLEDGKYYRTRDGRKVGPMRACGTSGVFFSNEGTMWYSNGDFYPGMPSEHDIVAEWVDNDHIERTKRMIEVMQAYVDGHPVESMTEYSAWQINPNPLWDFRLANYRIAKTPDSINWDHVAPEFKYMARNKNGAVSLFREIPRATMDGAWSCFVYERPMSALSYASYRKGTCEWKDSLVIRPGFE